MRIAPCVHDCRAGTVEEDELKPEEDINTIIEGAEPIEAW